MSSFYLRVSFKRLHVLGNTLMNVPFQKHLTVSSYKTMLHNKHHLPILEISYNCILYQVVKRLRAHYKTSF